MVKKYTKILILGVAGIIGASIMSFGPVTFAGPVANTKPLPGYWQFSTRAPLINDKDEYCLSQAEIDKFYANPCNRSNVCSYSTKAFSSDGTVALDGTWTDKKKRSSKVKGSGTFKADNMRLNLTVKHWASPIAIKGVFEAKRLSAACPK